MLISDLGGLISGLRELTSGIGRGRGVMDGSMDGKAYRHMEIHTCVPQNISPLGPLYKKKVKTPILRPYPPVHDCYCTNVVLVKTF